MNINLQVKFENGDAKVIVAKAADLVAFEERFDLSVARLEQNIKMTHLFFLAWHAEKRTGETKETFEKWLESVESIEATDSKK